MADLTLSSVAPSSVSIYVQLRDYLLKSNSVLKNTINTDVTSDLLQTISAVGAFSQQKILRAVQDAYPETAVSDRAIYALADFLGIRIQRRSPAQVQVTLSTTTSRVIPAYTQFRSSGSLLFNRDPITIRVGVPQTVTLFSGRVALNVVSGIGTPFQIWTSPESEFTVSEEDVMVQINGYNLEKSKDAIWNLTSSLGFMDRTLPDGRACIMFGNSQYGYVPNANDTINILYVVTSGADANSIDTSSNTKVSCDSISGLSGTLQSSFSNGLSFTQPLLMKNVASYGFGALSSAITSNQLESICKQYPGVLDVFIQSQRDIDPTSTAWMNIVKVTPLTSTYWNSSERSKFVDFLKNRSLMTTHFVIDDPVAYPVDISLNIYSYSWANKEESETSVRNYLDYMFELGSDSLQKDIFKSDLFRFITATPTVEYFEILSPTKDVIITTQPVTNLTVSYISGGSISGSTYYGIAVKTASGIVTVKNWVSSSGTGSAVLSWDEVPGAIEYYVYGRSFGSAGLLATVLTNSYTDTGSSVPGATAPSTNSIQILYPVLGTVTINSYTSTRR